MLLPAGVRAGDHIIGFSSPGLRSNGYSLARRAFERAGRSLDQPAWRGARHSLGAELLRPSVIYAPAVAQLRRHAEVHALCHVTGGGIAGNLDARASRRLRRDRAAGPMGGAAHLQRDPGGRRRLATTRWSTSSTSGSGCSRSSTVATRTRALDAVRSGGHEAWLVGVVDRRRRTRDHRSSVTRASAAQGEAATCPVSGRWYDLPHGPPDRDDRITALRRLPMTERHPRTSRRSC